MIIMLECIDKGGRCRKERSQRSPKIFEMTITTTMKIMMMMIIMLRMMIIMLMMMMIIFMLDCTAVPEAASLSLTCPRAHGCRAYLHPIVPSNHSEDQDDDVDYDEDDDDDIIGFSN